MLKSLCTIKYGALVLLVVQNTSLVTLMGYSRHIKGPMYASSTAVYITQYIVTNII